MELYIETEKNPALEKLLISLAVSRGWESGYCRTDSDGLYDTESEAEGRASSEYYFVANTTNKWLGWSGVNRSGVKPNVPRTAKLVNVHEAIKIIDETP